jgi:hypothetical protein
MKAEEIIEEALTAAQNRGIKIVRGAIFDWRDNADPSRRGKMPCACNAVGAVLLHFGMQDLARGGFSEGWIEKLCGSLGTTWPWLWRFIHGWDYGSCLTVTYMEKGKERTAHDETSRDANRLALEWARRANAAPLHAAAPEDQGR